LRGGIYLGASRGHDRRRRNIRTGRTPGTVSFRYTGPNENFVLVSRESGGGLQANSAEKLVEIIRNALVEPVQCASFLFGQFAICGERAEQSGG
jgi:hypothetical protein